MDVGEVISGEWLSNHLVVLRQEILDHAEFHQKRKDPLVADLFLRASHDLDTAHRHVQEAYNLVALHPRP